MVWVIMKSRLKQKQRELLDDLNMLLVKQVPVGAAIGYGALQVPIVLAVFTARNRNAWMSSLADI
jgi:hypothetical protein